MKNLTSQRTIKAPREVCFEMIRNVEVHAAAVPGIRARAEAGCRQGPLCVGHWTRWSAVYFGIRFRLTLEATDCSWPIRYVETARPGLFRHFRHDYLFLVKSPDETVVKDSLTFEGGPGMVGRWIDSTLLAPRLQKALDQRMDSIQRWCEDGTWKQWIPANDALICTSRESVLGRESLTSVGIPVAPGPHTAKPSKPIVKMNKS